MAKNCLGFDSWHTIFSAMFITHWFFFWQIVSNFCKVVPDTDSRISGQKNSRIYRELQPAEKVFLSIFWVLRTLRDQWQSCGQLRKYGMYLPAKELCSLDSRDFLKKIE
ncbi:MAG TPA: hypothetical protein IAB37_04305 [Candidatus Faecivivens stercoravium]|uniref:Uncharacterized protein n=1 Tax=Candidatus Faecivivens stercoravium TaxID=2840803 RepID=A0A9D1DXE2_9FIRM|nr:hypothetical protein [Candidatus Faecivivens stercoravium]